MKSKILSAVALMLSGTFAVAAPTVNGLTISWPDDGWYQVQRVSNNTFTEVCQGGRSCDVSPGVYNVINLSTQTRFDGITVEGGSTETSPIVVTGNTISWPDNGWYQVLSEQDYSEVCGGTRSCVVSPGSYSVINHSAGVRYDGIAVEQGTQPQNPIVVTGNTISWPDDGWYQVQSSSTYASVCEGGRSCVVADGSYSVINHATGMRWADIVVGGSNATTIVEFYINVPAYQSNELTVDVSWGGQILNAEWEVDEAWYTDGDLPTGTELPLVVTFYDRNGVLILGRYQQSYKTGSGDIESHTITADQFDTQSFDDDNDGKSNLSELIAVTDPLVADSLGEFSLLDVSSNLIDTVAGYQLDRLAAVVDDFAYITEQTTTITWPNTDWYQVQIVENDGNYRKEFPQVFATACNGGAECKLLPGKHAVINHNTGERSYLEVPRSNREDHTNATRLADSSITSVDPEYLEVTITMEQWQYNCPNGGTMIIETGDDVVRNIPGHVFGTITPHSYTFDQCDVTVNEGLLPNGNYRLQGKLETLYVGSADSNSHYNYEGLSIIGENGLEYHADGRVLDVDGYDGNYRRTAAVAGYRKVLPAGQIGESLSDTSFEYAILYTLNADGMVSSADTANQQVTINTDPELTVRRDSVFSGAIEMRAEDGSVLYENANPVIDEPTSFYASTDFELDQDYTSSTGERTEVFRGRFSNNYDERTSGCDGRRSRDTNRLICVTGYKRGLRDITAP